MNLGLSMWSYFHAWKAGKIAGVGEFVREAARVGVDGVELLDVFYRERDIDLERNAALQALKETGLTVGVFSVAQNFAKPDVADRHAELDKIKFGVDEANFYGAHTVRVFAGDVHTDGIDFDQAKEWIIEGLSHASVYAAGADVRLALENHGKLAGRWQQVQDIIEQVRERSGTDVLGANPDTGNFFLVGQTAGEALKYLAPYANMVHFKDFKLAPEGHAGFAYEAVSGQKYIGTAIGEGEVELGPSVELLKNAGFKGWMNIEYEGEEDSFTAIPRSVENARRYMSAAN